MEKYNKLKQELMVLIKPCLNNGVFRCDNLVLCQDRDIDGEKSPGALLLYSIKSDMKISINTNNSMPKMHIANYDKDAIDMPDIIVNGEISAYAVLELWFNIIKKKLKTFTFTYDVEDKWVHSDVSFDKSSIDNIISAIMFTDTSIHFSYSGYFEIVIDCEEIEKIHKQREQISTIILKEI